MTVNDRLQEAIEKYGTPELDNRVTINLDDIPRIAYRAGLDAVQPLPTDAEIEAAIREYVHSAADAEVSAQMRSWDGYEYHGEEAAKARSNLLRLIAQQREAAVLEALEAVREWIDDRIVVQIRERVPVDPELELVVANIDAMLAKEDGDE